MKITSKMSTELEPRIQTREPHLQLISMKQATLFRPTTIQELHGTHSTAHISSSGSIHIVMMRAANMYCESICASFSKRFICMNSFSLCNNYEVNHVVIKMLGQTVITWGFQLSSLSKTPEPVLLSFH